MKVRMFHGNMSILVIGSPPKEINIQRGLRQEDHLTPFFVFVSC
jgi:hypothetical protein